MKSQIKKVIVFDSELIKRFGTAIVASYMAHTLLFMFHYIESVQKPTEKEKKIVAFLMRAIIQLKCRILTEYSILLFFFFWLLLLFVCIIVVRYRIQ